MLPLLQPVLGGVGRCPEQAVYVSVGLFHVAARRFPPAAENPGTGVEILLDALAVAAWCGIALGEPVDLQSWVYHIQQAVEDFLVVDVIANRAKDLGVLRHKN